MHGLSLVLALSDDWIPSVDTAKGAQAGHASRISHVNSAAYSIRALNPDGLCSRAFDVQVQQCFGSFVGLLSVCGLVPKPRSLQLLMQNSIPLNPEKPLPPIKRKRDLNTYLSVCSTIIKLLPGMLQGFRVYDLEDHGT